MRPVIVMWLHRHGVPDWLAPDYAMMVGISAILGAALILKRAERDGARVDVEARALAIAYVAALVGGYVFEWLRALPEAARAASIAPIAMAGRAAYGGLIFGLACPALYLRRRRMSVLGFLDRATVGMGLAFACVRFGCFLEGCDYGRPTASWLGVRFPSGSLAAEAHAQLGWVPEGAPSLPVHATELYESCLGLVATALALVPLRRGRRDGTAFAAWLVVYALGRFALETIRGDVERGRYGAFSTAQWVSIAILLAIVVAVALRRRASAFAVVAALAVLVLPRVADADESLPPLPPAAASTAPPAPPLVESKPKEEVKKDRLVGFRIALVGSLTLARPDVPSGGAGEVDAMLRFRLGRRVRIDAGLEGRTYENAEARHNSIGLIGEAVLEATKKLEITMTLAPHHTWFDFKSDFFTDTNAYGVRFGIGAQLVLGPVLLGASPLAFNMTSSETIGVIGQWEPRLWFGVAF